MKKVEIAKIAHGAIMALRTLIGKEVSIFDEVKEKYEAGVQFHIDHPDADAVRGHENWIGILVNAGKSLGSKEKGKEVPPDHPEMISFDELDDPAKAERVLFHSIVNSCREVKDPEPIIREVPRKVEVPAVRIPVKYIGCHPDYKDPLYNTGIVWKKDETLLIEESYAMKFLRHKDVWVRGKEVKEIKAADGKKQETSEDADEKQNEAENTILALQGMTRQQLEEFISSNFAGHKVASALKVDEVRDMAKNLINQFGLPK